ncbi:MAG TPA: hypothetical protein VFG68_21175 [Fimbriiglobus sp.]|nr:hypothetical protein [Fimbriiglobus sp.]
MTAEDVRRLYWAEPFLPFQLVLDDGREVLVSRREHLTIAATGDRITVCPRLEDFEIVDLSTVKGVRMFGPPVPTV